MQDKAWMRTLAPPSCFGSFVFRRVGRGGSGCGLKGTCVRMKWYLVVFKGDGYAAALNVLSGLGIFLFLHVWICRERSDVRIVGLV